MKNKTLALSAAGLVAIAAGSAHAAQIMQTRTFGPTTPNFTSAVTFDKFDASLGTLLSVKVKMQLDITGGFLKLDNDGVGPASGTANLGAQGNLTSMDVPLIDNAFMPVLPAGVTVATVTPFNLAGNDGDPTNTFDEGTIDNFAMIGAPGSGMGMGFINPIFHTSYIDAIPDMSLATFNMTVGVDQIFDYGSLGGIQFQGGPVQASGNVMVIYDYTPVPAPGAASLAAAGGLLLLRRRRKTA